MESRSVPMFSLGHLTAHGLLVFLQRGHLCGSSQGGVELRLDGGYVHEVVLTSHRFSAQGFLAHGQL